MLERKPRVGLFVTCLVDLVRPSIGFAAARLLEKAGCIVEVPRTQTCCGQPAYNSGDRRDTAILARQTIAAFEELDYLVAPSGSCAGMIRKHYPPLFPEGSDDRFRAEALAQRSYELVSFLVDVMGVGAIDADYPKLVTYHDSCSGLRELNIRSQPRRLLASVRGLRVAEMKDAEVCCGFGGTFCVKYPEISNDMVRKKIASVTASGAEVLLAGDLGCLMNMAGKLSRDGSRIEVRHVAEVLAGETGSPPIGGDPA
jgi:L-lactate dehydrogenase complex protein LldE